MGFSFKPYTGKRDMKIYIIAAIALFLFGSSIGLMDHLQFHYQEGQFSSEQFWNPEISWRNKYKEGNPDLGPAYFGSTTFLAWTTDGWHLTKTIGFSILQLLIAFLLMRKQKWYYLILTFIIIKLVFVSGFHLVYTIIF